MSAGQKVVLMGAGGKMGLRCTDNLRKAAGSVGSVSYVEIGDDGRRRLAERGIEPADADRVVPDADIVIMAIPDRAIRGVAAKIVPAMKSGAMMMILDPAAPHGGELPERDDISYFVTHPCHPPVINDETDPEARRDFYGGIRARQHIVCALFTGTDADYARGEEMARTIFAPVMRAHRITVEQMATLEPAMSETVVLTLMMTIKEAMEEAVRAGVPEEAARDFLLGHINVNLGILFGNLGAQFSDGALKAVERGRATVLNPSWRDAFRHENIMREIKAITGAK